MKEVGCGRLLQIQYQSGTLDKDLGPSSVGHAASPLSRDLFERHAVSTYLQTCAITSLYNPSKGDILDTL